MSRAPYSGFERRLLLAFDVGTTFSGISFSILDRGKVPKIESVTKFPGSERAGNNAKVPSVIYYNTDGGVQAIGAEAAKDGMDIIAEDEGWIRAEWFKLHLDPSVKKRITTEIDLPHLPLNEIGKTATEIFADFLQYLNESAREYIEEVYPGIGTSVWENGEIHYILSHPNGWDGRQQTLIRQAAQKAGLLAEGSTTRRKITFVTEGEASLNCCIEKGVVANAMISQGEGVVIVDAGGGTIDVSAYACRPDGKTYEEIAEAQCYTKGSIFVTQRHAKKHLQDLLGETQYSEEIPQLLATFDRSTKCIFRNPGDPHFLLSGSLRKIRDPKLGIAAGRLRLDGATVSTFFEPSIQCIIEAVLLQQKNSHKKISNTFLVGGFAASDYLFNRVKNELVKHGLKVYRPDTHLNKVVSDGAIAGILDHPVHSRVSRFTYGVRIVRKFDPSNPDHIERKHKSFTDGVTGEEELGGIFSDILQRNTQVSEIQEFRQSYCKRTKISLRFRNLHLREQLVVPILCYEGDLPSQKYTWMDNDFANFRTVCRIEVNTTNIPGIFQLGRCGPFTVISFDIVLKFGLTELQAQAAWDENGVEKRGPAEIIYDTET